MTSPLEAAPAHLARSMHKVKCDFLQALGEVAEELGGEEFADDVLTRSYTDSNVPGVAGFAVLKEKFPDSNALLHARITEISDQRRREECEAIYDRPDIDRPQAGIAGYVRLAIKGIKTFRIL